MRLEPSILERPLSRRATVVVFGALMLPVIGFFFAAVSIWETEAPARSRDREIARDQARIEAGFPAVRYEEGSLLREETARRIVARHCASESSRLTAESDSEIVAMTIEEITGFCAESADSGEIRGLLSIAVASLLDDGPVRMEHRPFVASIKRRRVAEILFGG